MKPNIKFIKIDDNHSRILSLLKELVLDPRVKALDWSKLTKQTPNMKIGYPGQHLASLITGVEGVRTGARGDDLEDGSEIKSCSRVDQLDNCKDCKKKLLRIEPICPHCGSEKINRMNDSKWLFSVKSEEELNLLTNTIERVFLTISDYPNYEAGDFSSIRFQAFELWNNCERHSKFATIMSNYYHKIFLEHIKKNPRKTPAPKNFWPYSYQFYLCNPVKVFQATVKNADLNPEITIDMLVSPSADRAGLTPELMPTGLLKVEEFILLADAGNKQVIEPLIAKGYSFDNLIEQVSKNKPEKDTLCKILPLLDEAGRTFLILRDTDKAVVEKSKYQRR